MKKLNNKSFPYPVLGKHNNMFGSYDAKVRVNKLKDEKNSDKYIFEITHTLDEEVISKQIQENKAMFCVDIECTTTIFRKTFISKSPLQKISVYANDLSEEVSINVYIVAIMKISDYKSKNFNPEYGDNLFELDEGDILAFSENTTIFWADKEYQSTKLIKHFFIVRPNPNGKKYGPIEIIPEQDKIVILLSTNDYDKFYFDKTLEYVPEILHSSLVFPALNQVLSQVISTGQEYSDHLWFRMLKHKIKRHKDLSKYYDSDSDSLIMTVNDVPEVTQVILKYPFSRHLLGIEGLLPHPVNDENLIT